MHICYITAEYPVLNLSHGGIGSFVKTLGTKLVNHKINVSVIRLSNVKKLQLINDQGINVYLLPKSKLPFSFFFNSIKINLLLKKINKKVKIDIVETSELGLAFLKKIKGVKFVIRMHGGHHFFAIAEKRPLEWKKVWQEKKSFKKSNAIVAVSNYVADTTKKLLNLDKKIAVIYNPIDVTKFYQSYINKIDKQTIFFAGTVVEKKGIRQLIQSLNYLIEDYPNIKLIIAGREGKNPKTKEPYKPFLKKFINENIKNNIKFLGAVNNKRIPELIEKAHVCCYPSHMEAMPIAWLEVLAMGKTFIGSNIGPGKEAIINNETGYLVNPFDPKEIAEKIKYVFENREKAILIGKNGRKRVLNNFNIDLLVKENILFYKNVVKN